MKNMIRCVLSEFTLTIESPWRTDIRTLIVRFVILCLHRKLTCYSVFATLEFLGFVGFIVV